MPKQPHHVFEEEMPAAGDFEASMENSEEQYRRLALQRDALGGISPWDNMGAQTPEELERHEKDEADLRTYMGGVPDQREPAPKPEGEGGGFSWK